MTETEQKASDILDLAREEAINVLKLAKKEAINIIDIAKEKNTINVFHKALQTFPVEVFNGEEKPITKTLPEALTSISFDVKTLKGNVQEYNNLLGGFKRRKKIIESFATGISLIKKTTPVKIIIWLIGIGTAIFGIWNIILSISKWL